MAGRNHTHDNESTGGVTVKRRSWLTLLALVTTLAVFLAACGGGNTSSQGNSSSSGDSNTNSGSNVEAGQDKITLTMIVSGNRAADGEDFELDVLPRMVNEKFPHITLEVQKLPDDQYETNILTKLAAGEAPDIFRVWPRMASMGVFDMAKAGYLADLTDLPFQQYISQGAKDDMSYEGKIYGVTKGIDMLGVYYNKSLFEQAGISEVPQDWDAFLAASQQLKDEGITPIVMGDKDSWWIQFGMYQIVANTLYAEDKDFDIKLQNGEVEFTDPRWVEAISKYYDLYDQGYMAGNTLALSGSQAIQMFIDGQAAMVITGTWDMPPLMNEGAVQFERGFFSLPGNDAGEPVWQAVSTGAGWAVSADTKQRDAVNDVLNYWFDPESDLFAAWVELNPSISAFEGVPLNNELFRDAYELYLEKGNSTYFANQMWPSGVADEMQAKFGEMIGGRDVTPEDVATAMQKKFNELWK